MFRIVWRYILNELTGHFLLILLIFTSVLLMGRLLRIVEMVMVQGVGIMEMARLTLYMLPSFLPLAIPMATLMASVLTFSRMSSDREVIALRASGIGTHQILPPVFIFSLVSSLFTLFLMAYGAPWGAFGMRSQIIMMAKDHATSALRERTFNDFAEGFVLYAHRVSSKDGTMEGIFIYDSRSTGKPIQVVAKRASLRTKEGTKKGPLLLRLEDGTIFQLEERGKRHLRTLHFRSYELKLDPLFSLSKGKLRRTKRKEMTPGELLTLIEALKAKGRSPYKELVELNRRFSIPLACLIFGLLGLPLGLQAGPQGRSHGFVIGLGVIIFYYFLYSAGKALAENELLPPTLALWVPNLLFGGMTYVLILNAAKEKGSLILFRLNALVDGIQVLARGILKGL